jgi:hypothetical protein
LGENQSPVVLEGQLLQAEESQVAEYLVQQVIVPVSTRRKALEEDCVENLKDSDAWLGRY